MEYSPRQAKPETWQTKLGKKTTKKYISQFSPRKTTPENENDKPKIISGYNAD